MGILLAGFAFVGAHAAPAQFTPSDMVPIATERLRACITYHAVKSDNGTADISDLIAAARIKCEIPLGMWRFFVRDMASKSNSDQSKADADSALVEAIFFDDLRTRVSKIVEAGRSSRN